MMIIPPPKNTTTGFGQMNMIDNALTLGPKLSSKIVGRAQGFYGAASLNDVGLMMVMNFAFIEGKYNGSTFTILGRNPVFEKVREMAVIGGSGLFRFARGYVQASTHSWDFKTGDATVQYDAYVFALLRFTNFIYFHRVNLCDLVYTKFKKYKNIFCIIAFQNYS